MSDAPSLVAVGLVVAGLVAAPIAIAGGVPSTTAQSADLAPGERLSGVVGVGYAELSGEVDERTFGLEVARAGSDDAKARLVARETDRVRERLDALEERQQRLRAAHENGSMSDGRFRAEMAQVAARIASLERIVDRSARVAAGLPEAVLEDNGVNVTAIEELRSRAGDLRGEEVSDIARGIAGEDVGAAVSGPNRPDAANGTAGGAGDDHPGQGNGGDG